MGYEASIAAALSDGGLGTSTNTGKYSLYDNSDYFCEFCYDFDGKRRVRFLSDDLTSLKIAEKLSRKLKNLSNFLLVDVNLTKAHIDVTFKPKEILLSSIVETIENQGVSIVPDKSPLNSQNHDLMRIGMAAFAFLNTMLFASAEYLAGETPMAPEFVRYFHWTQFFLSIPIVFYCAYPVFKSSVLNALNKRLVIDQPIGFALFSAFAYSSYNVFNGIEIIYFDSVAAVTFLMISARYFQKIYLEKVINKAKDLDDLSNLFVKTKSDDGKIEHLKSSKIEKDLQFFAEQNDSIPVDSILLSSTAEISREQITGEPNVRKIQKGSLIKSGSTLKSQKAELMALENGTESYLFQIRKNTEQLLSDRSERAKWTDKVAGYFFTGVMIASALCFYLYSENLVAAFSNSIAMLLVACPCSFAIAIPLAYAKSLSQGIKEGVAFKNASSIENMHKISNLIFDKTGTLTAGTPEVDEFLIPDPSNKHLVKCLLTKVEAFANHHSVSSATEFISKDVSDNITDAILSDLQLKVGYGVSGKIDGQDFRLGSSKFTGEDNDAFNLFLKVEETLVAAFKIEDRLHKNSKEVVDILRTKNIDLHLLSGDKKSSSIQVGNELNLKTGNIYFEKSPSEKEDIVNSLLKNGNTAMVGDGMNDALAMGQSNLGISVATGNNFLKETSDVVLLSSGIKGVWSAYQISLQARKSLIIAFSFAATYNIAGVALSFAGIISPLIAAVTMPINSLIVSYLSVAFIKGDKR